MVTPGIGQSPLTITSIRFVGLKHTQPSYLKRFLQIKEGSPLDEHQLARDVQVLKNLYPVADARVQVDSTEGLRVTFDIDEALTLFPIIGFGGVKGNIWYQLGIKSIHVGGKGRFLSAVYGNVDRRHNFNIHYGDPYLGGSRFGFAVNLLRWASTEPLFFDSGTVYYDFDINFLGGAGTYEINHNQFLEIGTAYFEEKYQKEPGQLDTPGPDLLRQQKSRFKARHLLDRNDYHAFYVNGYRSEMSFETVHTFGEGSWYNIFLATYAWYHRLHRRGNLASRLRAGLSTNEDSPFAPFVIDSRVNIRGSGNRIDRGTGQLIFNMEYRHTMFDYNLFAGQVVVFSDLGTWRNPGGGFGDFVDRDNFRHFVGLGIRLIYKRAFDAMVRLDYGIDVYNKRQHGFVLGFGQYF